MKKENNCWYAQVFDHGCKSFWEKITSLILISLTSFTTLAYTLLILTCNFTPKRERWIRKRCCWTHWHTFISMQVARPMHFTFKWLLGLIFMRVYSTHVWRFSSSEIQITRGCAPWARYSSTWKRSQLVFILFIDWNVRSYKCMKWNCVSLLMQNRVTMCLNRPCERPSRIASSLQARENISLHFPFWKIGCDQLPLCQKHAWMCLFWKIPNHRKETDATRISRSSNNPCGW